MLFPPAQDDGARICLTISAGREIRFLFPHPSLKCRRIIFAMIQKILLNLILLVSQERPGTPWISWPVMSSLSAEKHQGENLRDINWCHSGQSYNKSHQTQTRLTSCTVLQHQAIYRNASFFHSHVLLASVAGNRRACSVLIRTVFVVLSLPALTWNQRGRNKSMECKGKRGMTGFLDNYQPVQSCSVTWFGQSCGDLC